jgi:hypothetical protein
VHAPRQPVDSDGTGTTIGRRDPGRAVTDEAIPALAADLARRLRASACLPGPSAAPTAWPCDPELLDWLRHMTYAGLYTFTAEENLARRWIGGDIFQSWRPPDPPDFLTGIDLRHIDPRLVAPLLRRISMTRPAPQRAELAPEALALDAGPVSTYARTGEARRWGQAAPAPLLPHTTVIPHVVHGIWLGSPPPATNSFWANYGAAADHYAGEVDFVLWTDIPRTRFAQAQTTAPAPPGQPDPLAPVRDLLAWASRHGIHLINVFEIFHAAAPMTLHTPFVLEMNQRVPQAFAAASDHLRVEVVYRFGGLYADGDLHLVPAAAQDIATDPADDRDGDAGNVARYRLFRGKWHGAPDPDGPPRLPALFDRVAAAPHGLTLNALTNTIVLNDLVVAPAKHPALALWLEGARYNYLRDQRELLGDGEHMRCEGADRGGEPASWTWAVTPARTGRVHLWLLARLGIAAAELVKPAPAVRGHSELSWLPPVSGQPAVASAHTDPLSTLVGCVTVLRWQYLSRSGDLCLTAIAPVVRGMPDPDAAWTALLLAFPDLSTDLGPVTSVTDCRRNQDQTLDVVRLPPQAEALLDRSAVPRHWFGTGAVAGSEYWFMGERIVAARLNANVSGR